MADLFAGTTPGLTSPAIEGVAVIPNDAQPLSHVSRALYVGSGGDLTAELLSGNQVQFVGLPSGSMLPVRANRVLATGTTASAIVALW